MTVSRLGKQIAEVTTMLENIGARWALIGGLALAAHQIVRATQDVDLLIDLQQADAADVGLVKLGYHCLHRDDNAGNYVRGDERTDFLYAGRPIAQRLLAGAVMFATSLGNVNVVTKEGLIGFKLQGFINDARRTQDLEDIRALLRAHHKTLNMQEVREYFQLFKRESLLEELIRGI